MTTIPEEDQERESELIRKINQKYPLTRIREVAGLAGRDPEYPLVLLLGHRQYTAVNPPRQFFFCCGARLKNENLLTTVEGILEYRGMQSYNNTVTDDDDELDFILDAEKKVVLALKDYFLEKSGGTKIEGRIYSAHATWWNILVNLEYKLETEEDPVKDYSRKESRTFKIPFPGFQEMVLLLEKNPPRS